MGEDDRMSVACVSGRRVVDVLADMRVRTVLLGDPTPLDLACVADVPLDIDLDDWRATETTLRLLHGARPLDAVFSVYDAYLPLASYLADRLEVRGLALVTALNCTNKARMRLVLEAAGIAGPEYVLAGDAPEARFAAKQLGFPVVLKKTVGARGRGALVCQNDREVAWAAQVLRGSAFLVERYVSGAEYAVQALTVGGVTEIVNVLAQQVGPGPRQVESGYDFPSGLGEPRERELGHFVTKALAALGFDDGVAHVQVRIGTDGPMLINVAARPPGGQLCAVTERVSGVDMTRAAAEIALGLPVHRRKPTASHVLYRCVAFDQRGVVDYDPTALDAPGVWLDVEPGDRVRAVAEPDGGSYGRIVVYGNDPQQLAVDYQRILDSLRPRVEPERW